MPSNGKVLILAVVIGIGAGAFLWPHLPLSETTASKKPPRSFLKNPPAVAQKMEVYNQEPPQEVSSAVRAEAARAGQIDSNPEESEKRLDELAESLPSAEIKKMEEVVIKPSKDGDLRAMAVELLARSKSEEALPSLERIIRSTWEESPDPRINQFEQALRARAIEGLQNHPSSKAEQSLLQARQQVTDPFLSDRAQRAYLHRKGEVPPVEEQDREALQKILEK